MLTACGGVFTAHASVQIIEFWSSLDASSLFSDGVQVYVDSWDRSLALEHWRRRYKSRCQLFYWLLRLLQIQSWFWFWWAERYWPLELFLLRFYAGRSCRRLQLGRWAIFQEISASWSAVGHRGLNVGLAAGDSWAYVTARCCLIVAGIAFLLFWSIILFKITCVSLLIIAYHDRNWSSGEWFELPRFVMLPNCLWLICRWCKCV